MRILALDTATRATVAASCSDGRGGVERRDDPPPGERPRHATRLLELAAAALQADGADWERVDRIAVGIGPGTFTGLRIGIATARGLAASRGIPLLGVSTLHSLALCAAAAAPDADAVAAVIDARRRELFAAVWPVGSVADRDAEPLLAPAVWGPGALGDALGGLNVRIQAVGDGAIASRELLEHRGAVVPPDPSELHRVSALGHCRLAAAMAPGDAGAVRPAYLRLPDAEINRRT